MLNCDQKLQELPDNRICKNCLIQLANPSNFKDRQFKAKKKFSNTLDFDEAVNLAQRMTSNYHSHKKDKKEMSSSKNIKPEIIAKKYFVV